MAPRDEPAATTTDQAPAHHAARVGPWGAALIEAATRRSDIVALSADLARYTDLSAFAERFPERYIPVGMAEQSLVLTAAGLALSGLTAVATSFAAFLGRRTLDFATMQVALPRRNVILVGSTPGISTTFGPSHASIDDLAIWRTVPGLPVIDPMDPTEAAEALTFLLERGGPAYLRQPYATHGRELPIPRPPFEFGVAQVLLPGDDVAVVASGDRVHEAVHAAQELANDGIAACVVRASTIKPFDAATVAEVAARCGAVVTAENHSIVGGLHSCVAEALVHHRVNARVAAIGIPDRYPPFGSPAYAGDVLHMAAPDIAAACRKVLA